MPEIDKETRARVARKMAALTTAFFDLMDEIDQLFGMGEPPKEDGPEIEDLQGPQRKAWLERVNPRRKLEEVTDNATRYLAGEADDEELEATHASWSGGGGSSDFQHAMMGMWSSNYTEEDDDGEE